jgi:asparagine synthase (glutamine-hydrolysing)
MLEVIGHRGPDVSGKCQLGRSILAQNYASSDHRKHNGSSELGKENVPFACPDVGRLRICYDGQMGNWAEMAAQHGVADGPFREERLLLQLYHKHGKEMLRYLGDTIFAFVISDGETLFAARDLLGIKTLFYGWENGTLYIASELKSVQMVADDVREFPAGHFLQTGGQITRFAELTRPTRPLDRELSQIIREVRDIIQRSVRNRVDFEHPTAALLSGGMDSSVIALLSSELLRERYGQDRRLRSFAMGVGESSDVRNARIIADHIGTDHQELIVDFDEVLEVLPEVIYHLESFDPSLVRSSVSNFLISKHARKSGVEVLLSGEGGDEIFCGYTYLKEFSQGSGSADVLPAHFEEVIDGEEFTEAQKTHPHLRSKEEYYYFRLFASHFGSGQAVNTVGQWISL